METKIFVVFLVVGAAAVVLGVKIDPKKFNRPLTCENNLTMLQSAFSKCNESLSELPHCDILDDPEAPIHGTPEPVDESSSQCERDLEAAATDFANCFAAFLMCTIETSFELVLNDTLSTIFRR